MPCLLNPMPFEVMCPGGGPPKFGFLFNPPWVKTDGIPFWGR